MISKNVYKYCKDDITKIENFNKAFNDRNNVWICHHKLELTLSGEFANSVAELKRMNMYFNRPYYELIFIKNSDHIKLHRNCENLNNNVISMIKKHKPRNETVKRLFFKNLAFFETCTDKNLILDKMGNLAYGDVQVINLLKKYYNKHVNNKIDIRTKRTTYDNKDYTSILKELTKENDTYLVSEKLYRNKSFRNWCKINNIIIKKVKSYEK